MPPSHPRKPNPTVDISVSLPFDNIIKGVNKISDQGYQEPRLEWPQRQQIQQMPQDHTHKPLIIVGGKLNRALEIDREAHLISFLWKLNSNLKRGTDTQYKALKEIQRLYHPSTKPSYHSIPLRESMPVYARLFNDLLFGSLLRYELFVDTKKGPESLNMAFTTREKVKGHTFAKITILEAKIATQQRRKGDEVRFGVNVLLHEMVHAFVTLFPCNRGECGRVLNELVGKGAKYERHGVLWVEIATMVERVLERLVGVKADLEILWSFARAVVGYRIGTNIRGGRSWNKGWNDPSSERGIPFERFAQWGFPRKEVFMREELPLAIKTSEEIRAGESRDRWLRSRGRSDKWYKWLKPGWLSRSRR